MEKDISDELKKHFEEDVLKILLEAIEKQMLYKPKWYTHYAGQCKCGAIFIDKSAKYCGNCGQKLDWR